MRVGEVGVEGADKWVKGVGEQNSGQGTTLFDPRLDDEVGEYVPADENMMMGTRTQTLDSNDDKVRNMHVRQYHPNVLP